MKCNNCKNKVDKDKLLVSGIKYFCSKECRDTYSINKKPNTIKQISDKKKQRFNINGTESELFNKRLNHLISIKDNYCIITGKEIKFNNASSASFAHGFPKGTYPELRYFQNNIFLVYGIEEHKLFDSLFSKYKKDYGQYNVMQDIVSGKEIYKNIIAYKQGINTSH